MELTAIQKPIFTIDVPTIGKISCRTCTLREYKQLLTFQGLRNVLERTAVEDIPQTLNTVEIIWAKRYREAIEEFAEENKDILKIPTDGKEDKKDECRLKILTMPEKMAADYTGLNFAEILDLDIIDFKMITADAYKYMIMTNKPDAVKYLNGCYAYMHDLFTADQSFSATEISII